MRYEERYWREVECRRTYVAWDLLVRERTGCQTDILPMKIGHCLTSSAGLKGARW